MIFSSATFAVLVLGGLETVWVVYLLAILSSTALVFDAPGAPRAHVPDGRPRRAAECRRAERKPLQRVPRRRACLRRRPDRGLRGRCLLRDQHGHVPRRARRAADDAARGARPPGSQREAPDDDEGHRRGVLLGVAFARRAPGAADRHGRQHRRLQLPRDPAPARIRHPEHRYEVFGILSACFGGGALVGALLSATLGRASWKALVFGTGGFSVCCWPSHL